MRKALVLTVVLLATTCFADSFQIKGTLTSPVTGDLVGTFAGTIEINTATGSIVSWYLGMPSIPAGFGTAVAAQGGYGPDRQWFAADGLGKLQGTIRVFAEDGVTPLATGSINLSAGKAYALVVQ